MRIPIGIILTVLTLNSECQLSVPNGTFETWDFYNTWTLEPQHWTTPNDQLIMSVIPDSSAFEGELAMKVTVLPGFEGGIPQTASIIIEADEIPDALCFAVKTNVPDQDPEDVVTVQVNIILSGVLISSELWYGNSTFDEWQTIELPLTYNGETDAIEIPVSAGYNGVLGGGSADTWISVDDMHFCEITSTDEKACASVIYPNPGNTSFRLIHCSEPWQGSVQIFSPDGHDLGTYPSDQGIINHHLSPGMYFIRWTDDSGSLYQLKYVVE